MRIVRVGDLAHLDAMLDPVVADQLQATLAAMSKASRTNASAVSTSAPETAAFADGNQAPGSGGLPEPKTHAERSADALEAILRTGMDGLDLPAQVRRRPHATVSVQLETLLGMRSAGRALLARFGLISTATAARVTCDAAIRLVVKQGARVLNAGTSARVVTDRQLAALADTYDTCVVPGCAIRFGDCEIHHLWWWSLGGPTDLDLQVPLCRSHHTWVHEGGTSLTREDGRLVFRDPRGRVITNTTQTLNDQMTLLHPQPPSERDAHAELLLQTTANTAGWPDSPYLHGRWGWTGQDPGPPPEHAPPAKAPPLVS